MDSKCALRTLTTFHAYRLDYTEHLRLFNPYNISYFYVSRKIVLHITIYLDLHIYMMRYSWPHSQKNHLLHPGQKITVDNLCYCPSHELTEMNHRLTEVKGKLAHGVHLRMKRLQDAFGLSTSTPHNLWKADYEAPPPGFVETHDRDVLMSSEDEQRIRPAFSGS
jgi:hypothetical protein